MSVTSMTDQQRTEARADLERLTTELVRLYQQREELKQLLVRQQLDTPASRAERGAPGDATWPVLNVLCGKREGAIAADDPARQALRSQLRLIRGGQV